MQLQIKNMVCDRCKKVVGDLLIANQLTPVEINLGKAIINEEIKDNDLIGLKVQFKSAGFEILDDKKQQLIEQIKTIIIQQIHYADMSDMHINFSSLLTSKLNKDYHALSASFSSAENITIEQFIILQKIEKVKELLEYGIKNLSEIALGMGYSSVAHLSAQFKKVTGLTPSAFKKLNANSRKPLDLIAS